MNKNKSVLCNVFNQTLNSKTEISLCIQWSQPVPLISSNDKNNHFEPQYMKFSMEVCMCVYEWADSKAVTQIQLKLGTGMYFKPWIALNSYLKGVHIVLLCTRQISS